MKATTLRLADDLAIRVDEAKGDVPLNTWVVRAIERALDERRALDGPAVSSGDAMRARTARDDETHASTMRGAYFIRMTKIIPGARSHRGIVVEAGAETTLTVGESVTFRLPENVAGTPVIAREGWTYRVPVEFVEPAWPSNGTAEAVDEILAGAARDPQALEAIAAGFKRKTVDDVLDARGGYVRGSASDTAPPTVDHRSGCVCPVCVGVYGTDGHP